MDSIIKNQLEQTLEEIRIAKKKASNTLLEDDDVHTILRELCKKDKEVAPLLKIIEKLLINLEREKYVLYEDAIKEILKYYNISDSNDFMNERHKLFFEDGKIVKNRFFTEEQTREIKTKISESIKKVE